MLLSIITMNSSRAAYIRAASVIIWNEAPMANPAVLACVEALLRSTMDNEKPFGGKIIILLGDFRQTCPVILYGTEADVIDASLNSSPLWSFFTIVRLTTYR